jgi:hypothetical protein
MNRRAWISISGFIWAVAGSLLLYKGLTILAKLPNQEQATWWVGGGLLIGYIKGRFVLSKTVRRLSARIQALEPPISFSQVYPTSYWFLLASMFGIGILLRLVPPTWHGSIDVAVGSALIHGALLYFKETKRDLGTLPKPD